MSGKSILVLGAGIMQLPALESARRNGWFLIVADGNPHALARDRADVFHVVDLKDAEGLLELARHYHERNMLDGVFTAGTDFSTSVAYIAESLGLPGLSYETALNATDKARMRRVLREAGVPVPAFRMVERAEDVTEGGHPSLPVVVKPVDNMGARGVRKVDEEAELEAAVADAVGFSRNGRAIVEEFINGPEFSIDALVADGTVHVCGIADRHIRFPPYFIEVGHTMPTEYGESKQDEVTRVLAEAANALGIRNGAAKGDIFLTDRGPVVGEVAARLSGGYMSGWTYPYASGVPVTEAAMRLALGLDPGDLAPRYNRTSAERAAISIPGTVTQILGFEAARETRHVKELFMRASVGDHVVFPRNNTEKCANVISAAETRTEAVCAAEEAVARLVFRLEPAQPETAAFLREDGEPSAFELRRRENIRALEGMADHIAEPGERTYLPLPHPEGEEEVDWNYRTLSRTLSELHRLTGAAPAPASVSRSVHGRLFWRFLLKGGLQGGLFYLDTVDRDPGFLGGD